MALSGVAAYNAAKMGCFDCAAAGAGGGGGGAGGHLQDDPEADDDAPLLDDRSASDAGPAGVGLEPENPRESPGSPRSRRLAAKQITPQPA